MFQIDSNAQNTSPTLQAPAAAGTPGYFQDTNSPGTIVDADFLNMVMMELVNVVTAAGLTPSKTTFTQVIQAIEILVGSGRYAADSGAVNALVADVTPEPTTYVAGDWCMVNAAYTNTGAATLAQGSLSPVAIKIGTSAPAPGAIVAGQVYLFCHDGTQWQLLNGTSAGYSSGGSTSISFPSPTSAAGTVGAEGWRKEPDGLITQWAYIQLEDLGNGNYAGPTWTFPIPFPTAVLGVDLQNVGVAAGQTDFHAGRSTGLVVAMNDDGAQLCMQNSDSTGTLCVYLATARGR